MNRRDISRIAAGLCAAIAVLAALGHELFFMLWAWCLLGFYGYMGWMKEWKDGE